jgi:RNA 3'-terminal phosphate cyclase
MVGKNAAFAMNKVLESECTVDNYTADQLLPLLVLAKAPSKFLVDEITSHTQTNLELIQKFIPRKYRTSPVGKGFLIEYL